MITNFKFVNSSTGTGLLYPMVDVFAGSDQSGTPISTLSGDGTGIVTGDVPVGGSWSCNMPGYYQVVGPATLSGTVSVDPLTVTNTIARIPVWGWALIVVGGWILYKYLHKKGKI